MRWIPSVAMPTSSPDHASSMPTVARFALTSLAFTMLVTIGCGGDGRDSGFDATTDTGPGAGTATPSTSGTDNETEDLGTSSEGTDTESATTGVESTGSTSGVGETETDTDDPGTTTGLAIVPCTGLDVLFVVDNSPGMVEEQVRLSSTAAAFVQMLAAGVPSALSDVNVAVITTDEAEFVVPIDPDTLEPTTYASGRSYMTLATLDATELTTALSPGEDGNPNERPMDMLLEATSPPLTDPGSPNGGFLRDDALLVVVLLTDEEDDLEQVTQWGSAGEPAGWIEALSEVKGGLTKDIAVLSIVPTDAGDCAEDPVATRLIEFTEGFPQGSYFEVCEPDYSTFLLGAVADLDQACENFTPP